ncbi:formimidoylglutamase, partial [Arachidicoccus sp.]|uniref:formimidoylglutamase n=1 Tax=Arachidicoccus sp. TaxID=1872624 RepID=UPI003D1E75E9
ARGPKVLRSTLSNLPAHFSTQQRMFDLGNIVCTNRNLEEAQNQLSIAVSEILKNGGFPVLLGGGHEILYGHYGGVKKNYLSKKIGVINFDAHFDLRSVAERAATSGTGFYQIAQDCKTEKNDFLYFAIGILESGNTLELFDRADELNVEHILARDFHFSNLAGIKSKIRTFMDKTDIICLTIDMDVFASADAPGVSAPSATGIRCDLVFYEILKCIVESKKVISMDIAELNPGFDIDDHTAKLAASIVFDWVKLNEEK